MIAQAGRQGGRFGIATCRRRALAASGAPPVLKLIRYDGVVWEVPLDPHVLAGWLSNGLMPSAAACAALARAAPSLLDPRFLQRKLLEVVGLAKQVR